MEDRRTETRIPFQGKAYLAFDGHFACEQVLDVSNEGLLIRSGFDLQPGKELKIFLPIPRDGGWRLSLLKAQVVRRGEDEGQFELGVALQADEIDARGLLAEYVKAHGG